MEGFMFNKEGRLIKSIKDVVKQKEQLEFVVFTEEADKGTYEIKIESPQYIAYKQYTEKFTTQKNPDRDEIELDILEKLYQNITNMLEQWEKELKTVVKTIKNINTPPEEEHYLVTYLYDFETDYWKTNQFTDKEKALEYYNRIKDKYSVVYLK